MATSSKRFMIILITTYILLGMVYGMVRDNTPSPNNMMSTYTLNLRGTGEEGEDTFGQNVIDESSGFVDKIFGNTIGFGGFIWRVFSGDFSKGLVGYSNTDAYISCPDCPDETIGGILSLFIAFYFIVIHILTGVEIYYIIVNKKND